MVICIGNVMNFKSCMVLWIGNVINIQTGEWKGKMSGVGAGLDSFYEYLLKVRAIVIVTK